MSRSNARRVTSLTGARALAAAGHAPDDARRDAALLARWVLGWTTAEWLIRQRRAGAGRIRGQVRRQHRASRRRRADRLPHRNPRVLRAGVPCRPRRPDSPPGDRTGRRRSARHAGGGVPARCTRRPRGGCRHRLGLPGDHDRARAARRTRHRDRHLPSRARRGTGQRGRTGAAGRVQFVAADLDPRPRQSRRHHRRQSALRPHWTSATSWPSMCAITSRSWRSLPAPTVWTSFDGSSHSRRAPWRPAVRW